MCFVREKKKMTDITKNQSKMLKGIAIFFMLSLHLYNTTNYTDIYNPLIIIKGFEYP